jgi:protein-L-isoaspartate(D-aspartate) O-methyltransferase
VTCSPEDVPRPLLDQLADGGRMVIPIGERFDQRLVRITRRGDEFVRETLEPTLFVPMTGAAEASRRIQPDGSRPALRNGGFEALIEGTGRPEAWYYGRQCEVVSGGAGQGGRYLRLRNAEPGRPAQIFQGFAIDGTAVEALELHAAIRGSDLLAGRGDEERPCAVLRFLDADRRRSAVAMVGPWMGGSEWKRIDERVEVPTWAREASLMVGLAGATGVLDVDEVDVTPIPR